MNVLFVSHGGRRNGGAQNVLYDFLKHAVTQFNCHCLFPEGGNFCEQVKALGVKTHIVKYQWWAGFELDTLYKIPGFCMNIHKSVEEVIKIIRTEKIDLVVSNTLVMAEGAFAAMYTEIPHLWYVHEILSRDPKLKHMVKLEFLYPLMLSMSSLIVGVSEAVRQEFLDFLERANKERAVVMGSRPYVQFDLSKIRVCHNGVAVPDIPPAWNPNNTVLSVGGICRRKGQMELLRAARYVLDEIPDARFRLAGSFWENGYRQELLEERIKLDIGKKFAFEKWQDDMDAFYSSGSILVSPSTCESFGLSLLEGMAHALPVVATDSGGPSEIVMNEETGYLVQVGDITALAQHIIHLLKNKSLAKKMGINGWYRVRDKFSQGLFLNTLTNLIKEAVIP